VVVISFSIIVLCAFISLLLVTVGITYSRMGSIIEVVINILFDGENVSFDASLVMYINSTSIPPIMIMNRMYENQKLLNVVPLIKQTMTVCISSIGPMAMGCFICVNVSSSSCCVARVIFYESPLIVLKLLYTNLWINVYRHVEANRHKSVTCLFCQRQQRFNLGHL